MSGEIPHPAILSAALALAENEDTPLNQSHIREANLALEAALCPEDDCLLPKGHDLDCLSTFVRFTDDRRALAEALDAMLAMHPDGAVSDACRDTLATHGELN